MDSSRCFIFYRPSLRQAAGGWADAFNHSLHLSLLYLAQHFFGLWAADVTPVWKIQESSYFHVFSWGHEPKYGSYLQELSFASSGIVIFDDMIITYCLQCARAIFWSDLCAYIIYPTPTKHHLLHCLQIEQNSWTSCVAYATVSNSEAIILHSHFCPGNQGMIHSRRTLPSPV